MKRSWKNFRIDKNKVYMRIGQATVCILFNLLLSVFFYWAFLQRNDLLGGKRNVTNNFSNYNINISNNILA